MRMCAEYGGMGLDATYMLAAAEEMGGAHCGGVASGLGELSPTTCRLSSHLQPFIYSKQGSRATL